MPIITGGILHLPDALERYPDHGVAVYHRCSTSSQAGPGNIDLETAARDLHRQVLAEAPGRIRHMLPFTDEAYGQLSVPKPGKDAAVKFCLRRRCILVAQDISRFFRAAEYHHKYNFHAWPKPHEFALHAQLTRGIVLATLLPPEASNSEQHGRAIKRGGKAGRPTKWDTHAGKAFQRLGPNRDRQSIKEVAKQLGVGESTIYKWLAREVPPELIGGETDVTWGQLTHPVRIFTRQLKLKLSEI